MKTRHISQNELKYLERDIEAYHYEKWYYATLWWSDSAENPDCDGEEQITCLFFMG